MNKLIILAMPCVGALGLYWIITKGIRDANRIDPDSLLRELEYQIENAYKVPNLYLIRYFENLFNLYYKRRDIDQEKLNKLYKKYKHKFNPRQLCTSNEE